MDASTTRQTHPFVIIAAIAVTLFCVVGIGAVMGWIPTSIGGGSGVTPAMQSPAPSKAQADATTPAAPPPAQPKALAEADKPAPAPVVKQAKPRPKPVARSEPPQQVAKADPVQQSVPEVAPPPPPAVVAAACRECAVVENVREVEKAGEASGVGAVGGAVVGGVLGHQVGRGRGKDIATVVGAIGGGIAGHQIEKQVKKTKQYQISVRYEDGSQGLFTQDTPPSWRAGDKVKVVNGILEPRN